MELNQLRLLVVEDNEGSRSILVSMLDGLDVLTKSNRGHTD